MGQAEDKFHDLLTSWVDAACSEWGYPQVSEQYFDVIYKRLPRGLRTLVVEGYRNGLIAPVGGYRFTLRGLPPGKGPYAWLSRDSQAQAPAVNWEYLIQAAEYARVYGALASHGYIVAVEDRLMDITVSEPDGALRWYIECKERAGDVPDFVNRIVKYGRAGVDLATPDRNNDPLRKAKYLIQYRAALYVGECHRASPRLRSAL